VTTYNEVVLLTASKLLDLKWRIKPYQSAALCRADVCVRACVRAEVCVRWPALAACASRGVDCLYRFFSCCYHRILPYCSPPGACLVCVRACACACACARALACLSQVADELVKEFKLDPSITFDEKNIRRRIYDALNVLMAMDIITRDKKNIR
jgi:hypothetical protein